MSISAWNELIDSMCSLEDRVKIEWAFGAIAAGDAHKFNKFLILTGPPKSGKTTVVNIARGLFGNCPASASVTGETYRFGKIFLVSANHVLEWPGYSRQMLIVDMLGDHRKLSEQRYIELVIRIEDEYEGIKKHCLHMYKTTKQPLN